MRVKAIHDRLPAAIGGALLIWLLALVSLGCEVRSKAGMGDGLVEEYTIRKTLTAWSRDGLIVPRRSAAPNRAKE